MRSKSTLTRVRKIEGQVNAIRNRLTDSDATCTEILQQVAAVDGALNGLMRHLIEVYLKERVFANMEESDPEKLEEFLTLCKRYL